MTGNTVAQDSRLADAMRDLRNKTSELLRRSDPDVRALVDALAEALEEAAVAEEELRTQSEALREAWGELEGERMRYRELFELAPDAYLVTDQHGVIREANCAAYVLLRPEGGGLTDKPLVLFVEGDRRPFRDHLTELACGNGPREWLMEIAQPRRSPRTVSIRAAAAARMGNGITGIRFILRDITERRRTELQLDRANDELLRFTSAVAHDLKAPLRAVHGLAGWVGEEAAPHLSSEGRQRIELMRERVRRMDELINDLLDYSRAGGTQCSEEVCTADLVRGIVRDLEPASGFRLEVGEELPCLRTWRVHLHQVFANLLNNAISHHHRADGTVRVAAQDGGGQWVFTVADDGPGIPREHHERVFEMFQRLDPAKGGGTGIGLALVRKVVEQAGGRVWLESAPGEGTAVHFTWPKQTESVDRCGEGRCADS